MSSFWCGKYVAFDICNDTMSDDCTGGHGNTGAGNVRSAQTGHNDAATTIRLRPYDASYQGAVIVFDAVNCTGNMGRFYAPVDNQQKAWYTMNDMWNNNIPNDQVDSLMVPYGYSVDLYEADGFAGNVKTVKGPMFTDGNLGMSCININGDFHDRTSSLSVYKNTVLGASVGYWTSLTASESFSFKTHYGLSYSHSESTSETSQFTLSYEMTTSIKFAGSGFSDTLSESY